MQRVGAKRIPSAEIRNCSIQSKAPSLLFFHTMLWVDKHRPLTLEKMDYLKDQATQLGRLASSGDLPHLLFYGPSGAGKKTRVMALLRAMFGSGVEKVGGVSRACWEEGEGMGAWRGRSTWGWRGKPPPTLFYLWPPFAMHTWTKHSIAHT